MSSRVEWLDSAAVAELLGKPRVRVQRWLVTGRFRTARKIGGLWFVHRSELEPGYDADDARSQRGQPVPAGPGSTLGGDGDDGGWSPPVKVNRLEDRGRGGAPGAVEAAGRGGQGSARVAPSAGHDPFAPAFGGHGALLGTQADNIADRQARGRHRPGRLLGEAHPAHRLTDDTVILARRLRAEGVSIVILARAYGVHYEHMRSVVNGKSWQHLAPDGPIEVR